MNTLEKNVRIDLLGKKFQDMTWSEFHTLDNHAIIYRAACLLAKNIEDLDFWVGGTNWDINIYRGSVDEHATISYYDYDGLKTKQKKDIPTITIFRPLNGKVQ